MTDEGCDFFNGHTHKTVKYLLQGYKYPLNCWISLAFQISLLVEIDINFIHNIET